MKKLVFLVRSGLLSACLLPLCGVRAQAASESSIDFDAAFRKFRADDGSVSRPQLNAVGGEIQYETLSGMERARLVRLAHCANAAYRDVAIPDGYRAFSGDDWKMVVLGRHYDGFKYDQDGYVDMGSGLRARLMFEKTTGNIVVAFSGCDLSTNLWDGFKDALSIVSHWRGKIKDNQYKQALDLFNGLLLTYPSSRFEVVGHSLGGGLTTFIVATCNDAAERVTGATFNGLGLSEAVSQRYVTSWRKERADKFLVNVKFSDDVVFKLPGMHYGPVYNLDYAGSQDDQTVFSNLRSAHLLKELIRQMEK